MPEIKQLDWANLQPTTPDKIQRSVKLPKGYKKYDKAFIRPKKKKTPSKTKKQKSIDKTLWGENFDQMQHLQSIMREA